MWKRPIPTFLAAGAIGAAVPLIWPAKPTPHPVFTTRFFPRVEETIAWRPRPRFTLFVESGDKDQAIEVTRLWVIVPAPCLDYPCTHDMESTTAVFADGPNDHWNHMPTLIHELKEPVELLDFSLPTHDDHQPQDQAGIASRLNESTKGTRVCAKYRPIGGYQDDEREFCQRLEFNAE